MTSIINKIYLNTLNFIKIDIIDDYYLTKDNENNHLEINIK